MVSFALNTLFLARTITPDVDMTIAPYEVTGTDGNGYTFNQTVTIGPLAGETGSSITLGSILNPATYWLSVVVTADGVVSSESVVFAVVAASRISGVVI